MQFSITVHLITRRDHDQRKEKIRGIQHFFKTDFFTENSVGILILCFNRSREERTKIHANSPKINCHRRVFNHEKNELVQLIFPIKINDLIDPDYDLLLQNI